MNCGKPEPGAISFNRETFQPGLIISPDRYDI
jgi:hypothetical protein